MGLGYRSKVDGNHKQIAKFLENCGWTVESLAAVGNDVPDLLVGVDGLNVLLEVKVPGASLTVGQKEWHRNWSGDVYVVHSCDDAFAVCTKVAAEAYKLRTWETPRVG